jgi:hypothetical protein
MITETGDASLRSAYDALLRARTAAGESAGTAGAIPLESILALVQGSGEESQRLATLDAVMSDEASRREFELLRALAANTQSARRAGRPWRLPAVIATLAAAAVLVAIIPTVRRAHRVEAPEPLRDGARNAVLLAPPTEASVEQSRTFRWRAIPDARIYSIEILTAAGTPVFTTRVADTTLTLPPEVHVTPGVEHWWWIVTEFADGTQLRSPLRRLFVRETK